MSKKIVVEKCICCPFNKIVQKDMIYCDCYSASCRGKWINENLHFINFPNWCPLKDN